MLGAAGGGVGRKVRDGTVQRAVSRLIKSNPRDETHDALLADALAKGHDASATKAKKLEGSLRAAKGSVDAKTQAVRRR